MEFFDEEVLKYRNTLKKEKYHSLEDGMYINKKMVYFQRVEVLEGALSIMLPTEFFILPPQHARLKYISESRPQVIMTSEDTTVNFTFSLLPEELSIERMGHMIDEFQDIIRRVQPSAVFYDLETELDKEVAWFDFKSYALDEPVYNIFYIKPVKGKLMHGIFNCLFSEIEEWKDAALLAIHSAECCEEKEEEELP